MADSDHTISSDPEQKPDPISGTPTLHQFESVEGDVEDSFPEGGWQAWTTVLGAYVACDPPSGGHPS